MSLTAATQTSLCNQFVDLYARLNRSNITELGSLYDNDVEFIDPLHHISGLNSLTTYFENLYANVKSIQFEIHHQVELSGEAFLYWTMLLEHPKLNRGEPIEVSGHTHLRFTHKIHYHRDYFDSGQMLYQHLPMLGSAIRYINSKVGQ